MGDGYCPAAGNTDTRNRRSCAETREKRRGRDTVTVSALCEAAARAGHDLNNVLSVIVANAYVLRQASRNDPELLGCIEAIERSVALGGRIVAEATERRREIVDGAVEASQTRRETSRAEPALAGREA